MEILMNDADFFLPFLNGTQTKIVLSMNKINTFFDK